MGSTKCFYTRGMPILEDPLIPERQIRYMEGRDIQVYRGVRGHAIMKSYSGGHVNGVYHTPTLNINSGHFTTYILKHKMVRCDCDEKW